MKKIFAGILTCTMLATSATPVFAAKFSFDVPENLNINTAETYKNGEHTMLPLRAAAEKLGYTVTWNGEEKTVVVSNETVTTKIYIGTDSYFIETKGNGGMTVPVMVGAAPVLKDGRTYVPAVMMNMLSHYKNQVETISE